MVSASVQYYPLPLLAVWLVILLLYIIPEAEAKSRLFTASLKNSTIRNVPIGDKPRVVYITGQYYNEVKEINCEFNATRYYDQEWIKTYSADPYVLYDPFVGVCDGAVIEFQHTKWALAVFITTTIDLVIMVIWLTINILISIFTLLTVYFAKKAAERGTIAYHLKYIWKDTIDCLRP